jgi:two-component sensor histidine kinase
VLGLRSLGVQAYAGFPVIAAGDLVGTLSVATAKRNAFDADEIETMQAVAHLLSAAIQRDRLVAAVAESEARLRFSLQAASAGSWDWHIPSDTVVWSPDNYALYDIDPARGGPTHDQWQARIHPEDRKPIRDLMRRVLEGRETDYKAEFRIVRRDGRVGWLAGLGRVERAVGGNPLRMSGISIDITDRKRDEEALRASHGTFQHLVDRSPFGIYVVDADFRLAQVSEGAQKVFENVQPLLGRDFGEVLHTIWPEPFAAEVILRFRNTLATGVPYHAPSTIERRADISSVESYDWKIERLTLPDGRPGVVCHFYDLSERHRQEEQIKLLMREIDHRSKNILGLVMSIARQTAATSREDFVERFQQRVLSLSGAHDHLVNNAWKAVPFHDLVRSQLSHFADLVDARIVLSGPRLAVSPEAAQALGMALHELSTNAAKDGVAFW